MCVKVDLLSMLATMKLVLNVAPNNSVLISWEGLYLRELIVYNSLL